MNRNSRIDYSFIRALVWKLLYVLYYAYATDSARPLLDLSPCAVAVENEEAILTPSRCKDGTDRRGVARSVG